MVQLPVKTEQADTPRRRLPPWLKRPMPGGQSFATTREIIAQSRVATVCTEARCPNLTECWAKRHATFMILGDTCTRRCHFCAVKTAKPDPIQDDEPQRLAQAIAKLNLTHVVITAVARDDLHDEGASHFARCVQEIHTVCPNTSVEVLPADFHARLECIKTLCDAKPEIYNHNIETVERLSPTVRPQANYQRSLNVLRTIKKIAPHIVTKSGMMIGLGESRDEIRQTLADLRSVACDVLTMGQYLRPSEQQLPVEKFYTPDEFGQIAAEARSLGFISVASAPFVRSSYNAAEVFEETRRRLAASVTV